MKRVNSSSFWMICAVLCLAAICASVATAVTITDPLQNTSMWAATNGAAVPAYQNMFGDPLSPDDGWFVQDNAGGVTWDYQATGWNKISSLNISFDSYFGGIAYGCDRSGNALPNPSFTGYGGGPFVWNKTSYDLSSYNYRGVRIDSNDHAWSLLVGTVQYDVTPMLGHLISENTVDPQQNYSKWFSADTNTPDDSANPGNIHVAYQNIMGDPLGPDDGWEAGGSYGDPDWFSYKTVSGQTFALVQVSFAKYPVWGAVDASLQYLNGSTWVDVAPTLSNGTQGTGFSWFTRTYDLTGISPTQIRVSGSNWSTQVGTVKLTLTSDLAPLTFSPDAGRFTAEQNVAISCATPGVTIRYTTDGTEPTETNGTVITSGASVTVDRPLVIKAKAWLSGHNPTLVKTAYYQFLVFADDWTDNTVQTPYYNPTGADWVREVGGFSANADVWEYAPSSFFRGLSGTLMFTQDAAATSRIHVDFGSTAAGTPVEARFKLHQAENAEPTGFYFDFGLKDTVSGRSHLEQAVLTTGYYGSSGFHGYDAGGGYVVGTPGTSLHNTWNYLKMIFDPASGVQLWQAVDYASNKAYDDPSLAYTMVAQWSNWNDISSVNEFYMDNGNSDSGARPSWKVDDVEVYGVTTGTFASFTSTPVFTPDAGIYSTAQNVSISSATAGATIRYTTDGSDPTETNGTVIVSGASVLVSNPLTLKAKAWATGHTPSTIKTGSYNFIDFPVPEDNNVVVDGQLTDWASATWAPLDKTYIGYPDDIETASFSLKWSSVTNKIYFAVKVKDLYQYLDTQYVDWDQQDDVELYVHTDGSLGNFQDYQEPAQQYTLGFTSINNDLWSAIGYPIPPFHGATPVPASAGFQYAGSISGDWLYYEAAVTPFKLYDGIRNPGSPQNQVTTLADGQVLGLDVVASTITQYLEFGMLSANTMTGKSANFGSFGLHQLVGNAKPVSIVAAKSKADGAHVICSGIVSATFTDYLHIESSDRTFGIRVSKTAHGRTVGQNVDVTGTVQTLATGERYIDASDVSVTAGSGTILPLAMSNKALGGGSLGLQSGVEGGVGLNNIGLLVRTSGKVTTKGTGWFMIDDGSGVSVKVYGAVPSGTPYVSVTGASSCEKDGSSKIQRAIQSTSVQTL